jgi:O-antigen ligase
MGSTIFLAFWGFVSGLNGEDFIRAGRPIIGFGLAGITYFAMVRTVDPKKIDQAIYIFVAMGCLNAAISFIAPNIEFLRELIFGHRDRSEGLFKHPNQFAMVLTTIIPVVLAMALVDRKRQLAWAAALAMLMIGFIFAGSKFNTGVLLAASFLVGTAAAFTHPSGLRAVLLFVGMLVVGSVIAVIVWNLILIYNPRMGALLAQLASGEAITSMTGRYNIWRTSMAEFYADPLFGQGGGAMLAIDTRDIDLTHSHNVILDVMRTMGVPGLVAIVVMVTALLGLALHQMRIALSHSKASRVERLKLFGLAIGLISYVAANMSSDSFGPSTTPIFWILLGITVFQTRKVQYQVSFARTNAPPRS